MKHRFLYIMVLLLTAATGAWADDDPQPIDLTSTDGKEWTLASMPEYDVELEVTYYTDSELTDMAVDAINALPLASNVSTNNEAAIEAASALYNALSDKSGIPASAVAKLQADEVALAIAELPSNVSIDDKDAIIAARTAYDALSDDQKTAVGAAALATLVEAEKALCFKVDVPAGGYVTFITNQPLCAYSGTSPVAVLYTVSNVAGTTVTLSSAIDTASVNTPLLIHNTANTDATLYLMPCKTPAVSTTSFAGFKGTAVDKAEGADGNGPWNFAANTKYYGFDGQNFVRIVAAGSVAANRCWIELVGNSGARQLTIVRGETTGVAGVKDVNAVSDENWYDLQGRKVQGKPARKGMYLQNGQKIIIK